MTPSPHIISLEIFTILRQISASPLAWNCVVKMVICWQGWGGDYQKKLYYACFEFHFRDRQYCHCGSVEPPIDLSVGYEMCGDECPPSEWTQEYSADPWAMTMYEPCGKSHYTMVRRAFYQIYMTFSQIYSTSYTNYAYWECTTDGGPESGQPCVFPFTEIGGWALGNSTSVYLSIFIWRWDTWSQGSSVEKGQRQGENMTHIRCAGG